MEKKIKSKHDTFMRQYKDDLSKDILAIIGKEEITDEIKITFVKLTIKLV